MALVGLLLRARARQRWRSWLSLCMLVALVSGLVLAAAASARRTATAFPGFEAAHGYDAFVVALERRCRRWLRFPRAHRVTRAGDCAATRWWDPHRLVPGDRDHRLPARIR